MDLKSGIQEFLKSLISHEYKVSFLFVALTFHLFIIYSTFTINDICFLKLSSRSFILETSCKHEKCGETVGTSVQIIKHCFFKEDVSPLHYGSKG